MFSFFRKKAEAPAPVVAPEPVAVPAPTPAPVPGTAPPLPDLVPPAPAPLTPPAADTLTPAAPVLPAPAGPGPLLGSISPEGTALTPPHGPVPDLPAAPADPAPTAAHLPEQAPTSPAQPAPGATGPSTPVAAPAVLAAAQPTAPALATPPAPPTEGGGWMSRLKAGLGFGGSPTPTPAPAPSAAPTAATPPVSAPPSPAGWALSGAPAAEQPGAVWAPATVPAPTKASEAPPAPVDAPTPSEPLTGAPASGPTAAPAAAWPPTTPGVNPLATAAPTAPVRPTATLAPQDQVHAPAPVAAPALTLAAATPTPVAPPLTTSPAPSPTPAAEPAPEAPRKGWMERLKAGLRKTGASIASVFVGTRIDDALYEELETALLMADTGVKATEHLLDDLKRRVKDSKTTDPAAVKGLLADAITELLLPLQKSLVIGEHQPTVIMVAGVNGAGKTTSIGKLTKHLSAARCSVLLAAADTFRAAAREQLGVWADRNTVEIISQEGGDPAAVAFDAVSAGRARGRDVVLVDTAGRLPTQLHLMEELKKIKRVVQKADATGPHEVLLVIDGNTGQNALAQVRAFDDALKLTGLIVTKLDGTAKGGVLAAIARERPVPVYFIGVGEKLEDLETFNAREFAQALLS